MSVLDRMFKLKEHGTTVGTELRGGLVTFLTMCYIVFVQPIILMETGLSWHSVFIATCVSAAAATLLMAFCANYPIALAGAMGHNVLFANLCRNRMINWQTGLGAVCISGTLFIILSFWGMREKIVNAVPSSIKHAIAVGIGILIAFLGFQWAGLTVGDPDTLVQMGPLLSKPALLALGGLLFTAALMALRFRGAILLGILVTTAAGIPLGVTSTEALNEIKERGLISIPEAEPMPRMTICAAVSVDAGPDAPAIARAVTSALENAADNDYEPGRFTCDREVLKTLEHEGPCQTDEELAALLAQHLDTDIAVLPRFEGSGAGRSLRVIAFDLKKKKVWRDYGLLRLPATDKALARYANDAILGLPGHNGLLKLDVMGALKLGLVHVIFIFFFLDLFDTIGTLIGVSQQAGFLRDGKLPRARRALMADAFGTVIGAGLGTSTVTSYIESSAGVADGARTGLANISTAVLFIAAIFFSPVVRMIGGVHIMELENGRILHLYPAVAPVLIIIGSIMLRNVVHITWTDPTEALPAFLAIMVMPLTFSITEGIAFGFISYSFLKLVTGRGREVHWLVYVFSVLFLLRYAYVL